MLLNSWLNLKLNVIYENCFIGVIYIFTLIWNGIKEMKRVEASRYYSCENAKLFYLAFMGFGRLVVPKNCDNTSTKISFHVSISYLLVVHILKIWLRMHVHARLAGIFLREVPEVCIIRLYYYRECLPAKSRILCSIYRMLYFSSSDNQ